MCKTKKVQRQIIGTDDKLHATEIDGRMEICLSLKLNHM